MRFGGWLKAQGRGGLSAPCCGFERLVDGEAGEPETEKDGPVGESVKYPGQAAGRVAAGAGFCFT